MFITLGILGILSILGLVAAGILAVVDRGIQMPLENLRWQSKDIDGPTSYVQATGQVLNASDFGLQVIQQVIVSGASATATGAKTYDVSASLITPVQGSAQQGSTQVRLTWRTYVTGAAVADAVNLSAQSVAVTVIGY